MNKIQEKTFLGIDYGQKRIGLAIGKKEDKIAHSFKIIHHINELNDIVPAKQIEAFVIGWPLQPDGTEGETCDKVQLFCGALERRFNLPIYKVDERLTSRKAETYLRDTLYMRPENRKKVLDAESARLILQLFFDKGPLE